MESCPDTPQTCRPARAGPGCPRAASRCCERLPPCLRGQDSQRKGKASSGHASPSTVRPEGLRPRSPADDCVLKGSGGSLCSLTFSRPWAAAFLLEGPRRRPAQPVHFSDGETEAQQRGVMPAKSPGKQAAEPRVESGHHRAGLAAEVSSNDHAGQNPPAVPSGSAWGRRAHCICT